jgi:hypothetical protein
LIQSANAASKFFNKNQIVWKERRKIISLLLIKLSILISHVFVLVLLYKAYVVSKHAAMMMTWWLRQILCWSR